MLLRNCFLDVLAVVIRHGRLLPARLRLVVVEGLGDDRKLVAHGLLVLVGVDCLVVIAEARDVAAREERLVGGIGGENCPLASACGGMILGSLGLDGLVLGIGPRRRLSRGLRLGGGVIVVLFHHRVLAHGSRAVCERDWTWSIDNNWTPSPIVEVEFAEADTGEKRLGRWMRVYTRRSSFGGSP